MGASKSVTDVALAAGTLGICPPDASATRSEPELAGCGPCSEVRAVWWEMFIFREVRVVG